MHAHRLGDPHQNVVIAVPPGEVFVEVPDFDQVAPQHHGETGQSTSAVVTRTAGVENAPIFIDIYGRVVRADDSDGRVVIEGIAE